MIPSSLQCLIWLDSDGCLHRCLCLDYSSHFEETFQIVYLTDGHYHQDERFECWPQNDTWIRAFVNRSMEFVANTHVLLFVLHRRQTAAQFANLKCKRRLTEISWCLKDAVVLPYLPIWCVPLRFRLVHLVRVEHRPNPSWTSQSSVPYCPFRSQSNICRKQVNICHWCFGVITRTLVHV